MVLEGRGSRYKGTGRTVQGRDSVRHLSMPTWALTFRWQSHPTSSNRERDSWRLFAVLPVSDWKLLKAGDCDSGVRLCCGDLKWGESRQIESCQAGESSGLGIPTRESSVLLRACCQPLRDELICGATGGDGRKLEVKGKKKNKRQVVSEGPDPSFLLHTLTSSRTWILPGFAQPLE